MKGLEALRTKIFADGADLAGMLDLSRQPFISGFTTNPTLMRKAGVSDYVGFAHEVLRHIRDVPVSFEVFADDLPTIEAQAREIAAWGDNVYVKIPVTNTKGESAAPVVERLSRDGAKLNVTAVFTEEQVTDICAALDPAVPAIVSVFAGRIADTGRDPLPAMSKALDILAARPRAELLWASPREVFNLFQAHEIGCHIITMTSDQLGKLSLRGKSLEEFSRETVQMFHDDAHAAGFDIPIPQAAAAKA